MSDSDQSDAKPSGSGEKQGAEVTVDLDPTAIADLIDKHSSSDGEAKDDAKTKGSATHKLSVDVSGMTWGEVQTALGTTTFLPAVGASLTPEQSGSPLEADVHADLVQQEWAKIGDLGLKTSIGTDLKYSDDKVGGDVEVKQDFTFDKATLEATVSTDFATGKVTATAGLKFSF